MNQHKLKYDIGYRDKNNDSQWYTIIKRIPGQKSPRKQARFIVKFEETDYEIEVFGTAIKSGRIKDRYAKDVLGVACIGDAKKVNHRKEYDIWYQMISRCYNTNDRQYSNYGDKGIYVCDRWLCFENFIEDFKLIDGYDDEKYRNGELELDKDIKQRDVAEKVYSLDTCTFVNTFVNNDPKNRKTTSLGLRVIATKGENKYLVEDVPSFARKNNLFTSHIYKCIRGEKKSYKGWIFKLQEDKLIRRVEMNNL